MFKDARACLGCVCDAAHVHWYHVSTHLSGHLPAHLSAVFAQLQLLYCVSIPIQPCCSCQPAGYARAYLPALSVRDSPIGPRAA